MKFENQIICGDCLEVMKDWPDGCVDLVLTDPPYGIGYDASESSQQGIQQFDMLHGDDVKFDATPFLRFSDVILWGCNNYCDSIPPTMGQWYAWDKVTKNGLKVRIAECEYAWHKCGTKPRIFRHLWSGAYRASEHGLRSVHPTQKPLALMAWCIDKSKSTGLILDPFCGSGTTCVAAKMLGRRYIGIDISEEYCQIARDRLRAVDTGVPVKEARAGQGALFE